MVSPLCERSHALACLTCPESASLVQVLVRSARAPSTRTVWLILTASTQCAGRGQRFAMLSAKILPMKICFWCISENLAPRKLPAIRYSSQGTWGMFHPRITGYNHELCCGSYNTRWLESFVASWSHTVVLPFSRQLLMATCHMTVTMYVNIHVPCTLPPTL